MGLRTVPDDFNPTEWITTAEAAERRRPGGAGVGLWSLSRSTRRGNAGLNSLQLLGFSLPGVVQVPPQL